MTRRRSLWAWLRRRAVAPTPTPGYPQAKCSRLLTAPFLSARAGGVNGSMQPLVYATRRVAMQPERAPW